MDEIAGIHASRLLRQVAHRAGLARIGSYTKGVERPQWYVENKSEDTQDEIYATVYSPGKRKEEVLTWFFVWYVEQYYSDEPMARV